MLQQVINAMKQYGGTLYWLSDNQLGDGQPNLLSAPEDFSAAAWSASGSAPTITANAGTAFDGTNTADRIQFPAADSRWRQNGNLTNGQSYTISMFVRSNTGGVQTFRLWGQDASFISGDLTATTDFQRFSFTFTATGTAGYSNGIRTGSALAAADLLVWGAKLESGSLTAYTPQSVLASRGAFTDSTGLTPVTAVGDVLGLMGDKTQPTITRRNLLTWTQAFDNAAWTKQVGGSGVLPVVVANAAAAPDGTVTADLMTFSTPAGGSDYSIVTSSTISTVAGKTYTGSLQIKASSGADVGKRITLWHVNAGASVQQITLTADWQYVARTENAFTTTGNFRFGLYPVTGGSSGTVSVHIWGAQLELGSTATAYQRIDAGQGEWLSGNYTTNTAAYQATTANKPLIQKNAQGRYVMSFDGSNDYLQTGITTGNEGWVCAGVNATNYSTAKTLFWTGANDAAQVGVTLRVLAGGSVQLVTCDGVGQSAIGPGSGVAGVPQVLDGGWNSTTLYLGINGSEATASNSRGGASSQTLKIGDQTTGQPFIGDITAAVICQKLPPPHIRTLIRKWVGSLQGQTL
jgi:hypothetical protein